MSTSSNGKRKVKTGWERQERERRWWKTDRVKEIRMRELYVKELCANCCVACVAKDTCAKTIESGLGNSLTWLQKHCCRQAAARTVMKVDGLSRCLRQRVACHFRSSFIGI